MRLLVFVALICSTTRFLYLNMELLSEFLNEKKTQCDIIGWSNDTDEIKRGKNFEQSRASLVAAQVAADLRKDDATTRVVM